MLIQKFILNRKEYYEEYYPYNRDLSQKRSPATSRFTYHKDPEKVELILLLNPKQDITEILKKIKLTAAQSKASYHTDIEKSQANSATH